LAVQTTHLLREREREREERERMMGLEPTTFCMARALAATHGSPLVDERLRVSIASSRPGRPSPHAALHPACILREIGRRGAVARRSPQATVETPARAGNPH
jgi:hypothetical protein